MPNYDLALHEIRQRVNYEELFGEYMVLRGRGEERTALCPFHEETNPSFGVNITEGLYFCHNPECGAKGDFLEFFMKKRNLRFGAAIEELAHKYGITVQDSDVVGATGSTVSEDALIAAYVPPERVVPMAVIEKTVDELIIKAAHERLVATPSLLEFLEVKRGLTRATVDEYRLGFDGKRYFIPIPDERNRWVNIRGYRPQATRSQDKMISWRSGYGEARLFPLRAFSEETGPLYLFEGEMDCLLARQLGLNALTTTGGAGTWRRDWNSQFRDRDVIICYDVDNAGRIGANHVGKELLDYAKSIRLIKLPLAEPVGADFTNYIVDHGHTIPDFMRIVEGTEFFTREQVLDVAMEIEPTDIHLSLATEARFNEQPIRVNVMLSGKTMAPYLVPEEVGLTCPLPELKMCEKCPMANRWAGQTTAKLDYESNEVLQFIGVTDTQLYQRLKAKVGIPGKCTYVDTEVKKALNVEVIQLIPEIDRSEEDVSYVTRMAHFLGHGLQTNRSYIMTGRTVADPKTQMATHIFTKAVAAQSNIDRFSLSEDVKERLKAFQPFMEGAETLEKKVDRLWQAIDVMYEDIEKVTRIYQRRDLMLAVDLTYHSSLRFMLQGELVVRGWCESLIVGDSRTGKTRIVEGMLIHYGAGELSSGENTSLAGLVGGLHQIGTTWALQWGRIPLNDRRLLVIDEAGNLPTDQIARMSSQRSSGIADITKVHTEKTNARTRQIWISNPRSPRPLSSYSQGVLAVKELIGAPEDIARFDLVVTAASGDVGLAVVNAPREHEEPVTYTADICNQRVMFAWSRKAEQIVFSPAATTHLLNRATDMGAKYRYATEIPLVEPNEQRVKLARLAASVATMFYSTDEGGEKVCIEPEHVEFAYQFLERMYAKPSLAFDEYSRMQTRRYEINNEPEVARIIHRTKNAAQALMEQEQLAQRDLEEILGYDDRNEMRRDITILREAGFLRRVGSSYYVKTSGANAWLRREMSGGNPSHMTNGAAPQLSHVDEPGWMERER